MLIGKVKGTVISTNKCAQLNGWKLLIVQPVDLETMQEKGDHVVVMDGIGAGEGEIVMCVAGSSSRHSDETKTAPSDITLLAVIDTIDIKGERVYEKFVTEGKKCS